MQLDTYFSGVWQDQNFESLEYSGYQLVNYVNAQAPSSVLDVGCGYNRFKGKIKNLIGIDPYNDAADIKVSVEEYNSVPFEIALCLGSINFGNVDYQLEKLHTLWRKEAIFRVNPGIPHDWADVADIQGIQWYPWTKEKIYDIANQYKYKVKKFEEESVSQGHLRYFFIYTK